MVPQPQTVTLISICSFSQGRELTPNGKVETGGVDQLLKMF